jgi:acyl carrier protein
VKTRDVRVDAMVVRLMELLEEGSEGTVSVDRDASGPDTIRRLGLNSVSMLAFLVAVEDEFGIEWDDDVDEEILSSFDAMAAHIAAERGL